MKALKDYKLCGDSLKNRLFIIIFGSDTPLGKLFDVVLIWAIIISVFVVMFESFLEQSPFVTVCRVLEWVLTVFFSLEYALRIYCSPKPRKYVLSFFGIIDLLSILPLYFTFVLPGVHYILVIRSFRLIRVFRVFKLFNFLNEGNLLLRSLRLSLPKIGVFFLFVLILNICVGTVMYAIESQYQGTSFHNIPSSIYWSIVTMTKVGYGDMTPISELGKLLASMVMLTGYTIIAVPTGIVSAQMVSDAKRGDEQSHVCPRCAHREHNVNANYCSCCGAKLDKTE